MVIRPRSTTIAHFVRGDPARGVQLCLNLLAPHFLGDVGYANPQHANGRGSVSRLIIDCKLNLVRLVDVDREGFVQPFIIATGLRPCLDRILHLNHDKRLRPAGES